jgi:NACHT domain
VQFAKIMPSFSNAHSFTLNDASFTDVQGNILTYNIQSTGETGMFYLQSSKFETANVSACAGINRLRKEISESVAAFHDSVEHQPPPERHPEAQNLVLARILECIERDNQDNSDVLWLHGPAHVGKSAIAQTVAKHRAGSKELAAGFFFSRDKPGCNTASLFWATIAYQIAISIPALRMKISEAVEEDPAICQKSVLNQLQKLIIDPFTLMKRKLDVMNMLSRLPFLVIIDGLDECKTHADQREVIHSVAHVIKSHQLPLRFLITSRSEDHIRREFDSPILQSTCSRIFHSETFPPEHDDHWQAFRSTSGSGWKPFFHSDMTPTPMFITLVGNLFSYLDSSNSGSLYPEVTCKFLDDAGPLHHSICTCVGQRFSYMLLM